MSTQYKCDICGQTMESGYIVVSYYPDVHAEDRIEIGIIAFDWRTKAKGSHCCGIDCVGTAFANYVEKEKARIERCRAQIATAA